MFNIAGVFAVAHLMFPFPSMTTRLSPRGGAPQAQAHAIHTGHLSVHGAFAALQLRSRGMGVETPQHQQPSEEDDVWPPELWKPFCHLFFPWIIYRSVGHHEFGIENVAKHYSKSLDTCKSGEATTLRVCFTRVLSWFIVGLSVSLPRHFQWPC